MLSMGLTGEASRHVLASARPADLVVLGLLANFVLVPAGHARFAVRLPGRPDGLGGFPHPCRLPGRPGRAAVHRHRQGQCPVGHRA